MAPTATQATRSLFDQEHEFTAQELLHPARVHTDGLPGFLRWSAIAKIETIRDWLQAHGYPRDLFTAQFNASTDCPDLEPSNRYQLEMLIDHANVSYGSSRTSPEVALRDLDPFSAKISCCQLIRRSVERSDRGETIGPLFIAALRESRACRWTIPPINLIERQPGAGPKQYDPIKLCRRLAFLECEEVRSANK